jgi:hypothetical protein
MDKLIQTIQEEINQLMQSKIAKKTDGQLFTQEKLSLWRNSDENKKQFGELGKRLAKITYDIAKEIRDKFYYQNEIMSDLSKQYNIAPVNIKGILKNENYKIDDWNYPNFLEQKEKNKIIKNRIEEKIQFIKDGYGLTNFIEHFNVSPIVYYKLVKEYKLELPDRTGRKRAKNVDNLLTTDNK